MENIKDVKSSLEELVKNSEQIFLTPHLNADFDTIGSCVGMALIIKKLGKSPMIILDENLMTMEPGVRMIVDEISSAGQIPLISTERYKKMHSDSDLLIALDLNKQYLTGCKDYLDSFKNIFIMDHHKSDDNSIKTDYRFIDIGYSSVSEMVTELMCSFSIKYDKRIAEYLLAGIYLDTDKFARNSSSRTMLMVSKLMDKGADLNRVNDLFAYDFYSDRKVQSLVNETSFITYTVALVTGSEDICYTREELAKAADYLLKYRAAASFAIGKLDDTQISISARSKGEIDVGEIMNNFNGGGSITSAAAKIDGQDLQEVSMKLARILKPSFCVIDKK